MSALFTAHSCAPHARTARLHVQNHRPERRSPLRALLSALAASVLMLGVLTACAAQPSGASSTNTSAASGSAAESTFTVGLTYIPDIQFAPLYVAEAKGYFTDRGLHVTLRHHGQQEALLSALQAGEEDIVFAGGDEVMQGRSTGIDAVTWATMYQKYPVVLMVPADSGITSWEQLRGKVIGLPGFYGENYFSVLAALKAHNLTPDKDVTLKEIGYTPAPALHNHEVAGVIGFANNDTVAIENAGIKLTTIPLMESDLPLIGVGFSSLADNVRPQVYADFLAAVGEGVRFAEKDPEATLDITTKYVPALADAEQRATAKQVLENTLKLYQGADTFGQIDEQAWAAMSRFMQEQDLTKRDVPATAAYTLAVLQAVPASGK